MRKLLFHTLLFGLLTSFISADYQPKQTSLKGSYAQGEVLTYRLHYGFFTAGEATLSVSPKLYKVEDKICYKFDVHGKSSNVISAMYDINDTWRSYVDTSSLIPAKAYRDIRENSYRLQETTLFDQNSKTIQVHTKKKKNPVKDTQYVAKTNDIQDMVSAFYYLRGIDYKKMKVGETVKVNAFFEDEFYDFQVRYQGVETIKTKLGKMRAIKLVPIMPKNGLFDGKDALKVWLSDDKNKIPLKVKADMFVGAVEMDIKEHKGLQHSLNYAR